MTTDQFQDAARIVGYALSVPLWALIGFNWFNRRRYFSSLVALVCLSQSLILMLMLILNKGMHSPVQDIYTVIIVLLPVALTGYIGEHKFRARKLWLEDDDVVLGPTEKSSWRFLVLNHPRGGGVTNR